MNSIELKVKRLTLGAEARIIKSQAASLWHKATADAEKLPETVTADELRNSPAWRRIERRRCKANSLDYHRRHVVRPEARAAHLAHAFLRGHLYARIEDPEKTKTLPDAKKVAKNLVTFGEFTQLGAATKAVHAWVDGAVWRGVEASNPVIAGSIPAAVAN